MIGQKISDYKILEMLGQVGTGVVYKSEDKRKVTSKFLICQLLIH